MCRDGKWSNEKWFHIVDDCVFHGCFENFVTVLRITKFRRYDFVNQLLNANCVRVYNDNRWHFLPGANFL